MSTYRKAASAKPVTDDDTKLEDKIRTALGLDYDQVGYLWRENDDVHLSFMRGKRSRVFDYSVCMTDGSISEWESNGHIRKVDWHPCEDPPVEVRERADLLRSTYLLLS
jgi:hypothetical protein